MRSTRKRCKSELRRLAPLPPPHQPRQRRGNRIKKGREVAILGAGSWGTALAIQFARAGCRVSLWARDRPQAEAMQRERTNRAYLPGAEFPASLQARVELSHALESATDILIAVPSHAFRPMLTMVLEHGLNGRRVIWATKGFELESGLLPHQVAAELIGSSNSTAVLSGPTFATEVAAGLPSALTIASTDAAFARDVAEMIATETFRAYTSADVIGVEVGGATKNVYAIGAGISDGLGFGANTRIALVTRGLAEMTRLGRRLGARQETFMGLAGMGDLVLTCTDDLSRNRRFGKALASGIPAPAALQAIGQVVEGYYGARAVRHVARRLEVEMPIVEQVYEVLYEALSPRLAVANLMSRPIMAENA